MKIKIGSVYKIGNKYLEVIHDKDIFSKPFSVEEELIIPGMLNSYVSIPLYNNQEVIGIIIEQYEPAKDKSGVFTVNTEKVISKIRLIGTFSQLKESFKKGIDYYPVLNTDVFTIEKDQLEYIYNSINSENNISLIIGSDIFFPTINILANPNILFGKHCAVFGNTGSGKSCTIASILQGIYCYNRLKNCTSFDLKTIIIDSNDEYKDILKCLGDDYILKLDTNNLNLSHKELTFFELLQFLKETSPNVIPHLRNAILKLKKTNDVDDNTFYDFTKLPDEIVNVIPQKEDYKGNKVNDNFTIDYCRHIINRISGLINDERLKGIFKTHNNSIIEFLKDKKKKVLILSLELPNDILSIINFMLCKTIYNYKYTSKNTSNILLVLEEAHRYISNEYSEFLNNYYVEKVAKEGRKFGVNLLISTQRPSEVSSTVISQCNSFIVHKLTNIRDLEFIKNCIEYEDRSQIELLSSLKQQEALALGEAFAFSTIIKIANCNPVPDSKTPEIFK